MNSEEAHKFAEDWAAVWNAQDLDRVLSHYRDDFEMTSPFIVQLMGDPAGTLKGRQEVGAYWRRVLERFPDLHFEVLGVYAGVDSVVVHSKAVLGLLACEDFSFDARARCTRPPPTTTGPERARRTSWLRARYRSWPTFW